MEEVLNFFNFSLKKAFLVISLLVVPLFLVTLDRSQLEDNFLFRSVFYLSGRTQVIYRSFVSAMQNTTDTYFRLIQIKKNNRQLEKENKQFKSKVTLLEEVQAENIRLKKLLQFSQVISWRFLFAQVSGRDPLSQYQLITVNRGEKHGVQKGMPVIIEKGVVGTVFRTSRVFAHILLLTDSHSAIPVVVQRSRVHGVLEGAGGGKYNAYIKYLRRKDDVRVGDHIVTARSNPNGVSGFPIGKVTQVVKETYDLTQKITVTPFTNLRQLEEVLIITHPQLFSVIHNSSTTL